MKSINKIPADKLYVGMKVIFYKPEHRGTIEYIAHSKNYKHHLIFIRWDSDVDAYQLRSYNYSSMLDYIYYSEV